MTTEDIAKPARITEKPWGREVLWAHTENYAGKLLFIREGEKLSLQYHEEKTETIIVSSGTLQFSWKGKDEEELNVIVMIEGDIFHIPPETIHRMEALEDTWLTEVSTPELLDVVRLEDEYGRICLD